ncbi:MAG: endonuclease III domain-containing protein [Armatimonadota bacterium]
MTNNDLILISGRLTNRYHDHRHYNKRGAIAEIIYIMLSTRTEEYNYLRTYKALRKKYPRWEALANADESEIAYVIHLGGLSNLKAKLIKETLNKIRIKQGALSLAGLNKLNNQELENFLTSLPGVGVKTARCVMLYVYDRHVFPVDAHCWRICKRLGLTDSRNDKPTKREIDSLQQRIPKYLHLPLHVNFISLGREICIASTPRCNICILSDLCPKIIGYEI